MWIEKMNIKDTEIAYLKKRIKSLENEVTMKDELNIEKSNVIQDLELKVGNQSNQIDYLNIEMNDCCQAISKLQEVYN